MQSEWITINGIPTKVLTWGKTLEEAKDDIASDEYIICIPGNPGIVDVYIEFLNEIHQKTKYNVWIIGHAGHNMIETIDMPPYETNKTLYSLKGQIKHKASFIESYVPKNANITLIGHSIGAYIILNLLKSPSINSRVKKNYLLFPTIEYMAETKNGRFFMSYLRYVFFIVLSSAFIFNYLPRSWQNLCLYVYLKIMSLPNTHSEILRNFIRPFTVHNVKTMALQEMHEVRERDNKTIEENMNKVKLYYGETDGWCPTTYYHKIKKDIPDVDAELCDKGIQHAFVLYDSKTMADVVVDWIQKEK